MYRVKELVKQRAGERVAVLATGDEAGKDLLCAAAEEPALCDGARGDVHLEGDGCLPKRPANSDELLSVVMLMVS